MAIVAVGPIPGSTPMKVPSRAPMKQYMRFSGVAATPNPIARWLRTSMFVAPACSVAAEPRADQRDRQAQSVDKQCSGEDGQHRADDDCLEQRDAVRCQAG